MRITGRMMTDGFMQNLRTNLRNLDSVQRRMASGTEVSKPSDDPVKLQQILKLDTALDQRDQYIRNIDDANSWLTASDSALDQVGTELGGRIIELGTNGLNGTNSQEDMNAMAAEVGQLMEHLGEVANTVYVGRYVFAGSDTSHQPYNVQAPPAGAATTFTGLTNSLEYEVGQGVTMKVNTTGQDAFGGTELFDALEQLRQGMLTDNKDQIGQATDRLEKSNNTLLTARADIGARMNRLDATKTRYEDDIFNLTALKSQAEDVDTAQVVMELQMQESVYQASLAAGARIMQPSLLDYLR